MSTSTKPLVGLVSIDRTCADYVVIRLSFGERSSTFDGDSLTWGPIGQSYGKHHGISLLRWRIQTDSKRFEPDLAGHDPWYGMGDIGTESLGSIGEINDAAKAARSIDRKLDKMSAERGYADSMPEALARVMEASGAKTVYWQRGSMSRHGGWWREITSPSEFRSALRHFSDEIRSHYSPKTEGIES